MTSELLAYCATPSRLAHLTDEIIDYVLYRVERLPLHPFPILPRRLYEDGPIGRERTMKVCLRLVDHCDALLLFGVSEGTMREVTRAIYRGKPIALIDGFDPERETFYEKLKAKFNNPLDKFEWVSRDDPEKVKRLLSTA